MPPQPGGAAPDAEGARGHGGCSEMEVFDPMLVEAASFEAAAAASFEASLVRGAGPHIGLLVAYVILAMFRQT